MRKTNGETMSNPVDKLTDPEFAHTSILSRGQLQMIEDDPTKMETLARLMGAVNLDNLFRHMQNPTINPATRLEFQKMLNKMGKLEPDGKAVVGVDGGPQVIINITRAKDNEEVVIEGTSTAISE
jgi:hypothetical protein|tara:strand:+ start:734 stop:1108 length:375 start_codon:yes stop_codon:yes gene_type:complete